MALRGFTAYGIGPRAQNNIIAADGLIVTGTTSNNLAGDNIASSATSATAPGTNSTATARSIVPYFHDEQRPGNAFGGLCKFSVLGMLSAPININALGPDGARAFIFMNAGSVGMAHMRNIHPNGTNVPFFGHLRASVGTGLAITVGPAVRLEMTYAVPLLKAPHDATKSFQLGVGLSIS
jgi:outer membrane protein assembly factor BamA